MRVATSGKYFRRFVGGNSTYAAEVYRFLAGEGVERVEMSPPFVGTRAGRVIEGLYDAVVLPRSARQRNVDLIHWIADTGPAVRSRLPMIGAIQGMASRHIEVRARVPQRVWRERVALTARCCDRIITPSQSSAGDLAAEFQIAHERIVVIPHGVDHARFHPDTSGDDAVLGRLGLSGKAFCLYVGNLDPRKNVEAILDAAEKVIFPETGVVTIIGGAPAWRFERLLQRLEAGSPAFRYIGRVDHDAVAPLMRAAEVFLFPSRYEGFGFPVLEAMACGTAVVASTRGSLREVCGDAAVALDDIGGPEVGAATVSLLQDEGARERLVTRGLQHAARYTWAVSAQAHRQLFESLL